MNSLYRWDACYMREVKEVSWDIRKGSTPFFSPNYTPTVVILSMGRRYLIIVSLKSYPNELEKKS